MIEFSPTARLLLGLLVAGLGYLVAGELHVSEELRGGIAALTALLASVGIIPPKPGEWPTLSPQLSFLLTGVATAGAYVVNTIGDIDPTVRGLVVAALALAASVGIVPPLAMRR
jgi:hypothetical protein